MKQDLKKVIEEIKQETFDCDSTKKYILAIKSVLDNAFENCKDELTKEEVLKEYLEEYRKELNVKWNAESVYYAMLQYRAYKRLLVDYKGNKSNFDSTVGEAKKREHISRRENIPIYKDLNACMVSAVRNILRSCPTIREKDLIMSMHELKNRIAKFLKGNMIKSIQQSVSFLNEYGFLDEYIEESNKELDKLGLQKLKFTKRNPMPDEQYDENGELIENNEDIGVLDSFTTEYLEQLSPEDLVIMTAFWESKYMEERLGLENAMTTINSLGLWKEILEQDENSIKSLDNEKIYSALKKDLALTYLYKNNAEITPKMRRQYAKFLKENGIDKKEDLEQEIKAVIPEIQNLERVANDITILQCLIAYQLQAKDIKIKNWGTIEENQELQTSKTEDEEEGVKIALEHQGFRGPLVMQVPETQLKKFLEIDNLELPTYRHTDMIDENYNNIMTKLCLPSNEYFKRTVKQYYKSMPESTLLTILAGKKPKKTGKESIR